MLPGPEAARATGARAGEQDEGETAASEEDGVNLRRSRRPHRPRVAGATPSFESSTRSLLVERHEPADHQLERQLASATRRPAAPIAAGRSRVPQNVVAAPRQPLGVALRPHRSGTPGRTSSPTPPTSVAATATDAAIASTTASGQPS